jgi:DNA-binding protein YbaB
MTDAPMNSTQLREWSGHMLTNAIRRRNAIEQTTQAMAEATGSATSPDGTVTVTVDGWGAVTALQIHGHEELARTVTSVIREAAGHARAGTRSAVEDLLAEGVLREPPVGMPPDLRAEPVPAPPSPRRSRRDEDDNVSSIYDYD